MVIARDFYLDQLKRGMGGDLVKVVTGVRRCGKSFLLFNLFRDYLLETYGDRPCRIPWEIRCRILIKEG